ncbi:MAG: bifunctional phosphoribosylaminoimidazolecarboxamide formyltransferase/IMP cyclohydrolase [Actinomycetota bacterium]
MPELVRITTALVSVSDRTGLTEFCKDLAENNVRIIATDSTGRHLAESGIPTTPVAEVTGFPEMLGGRVKTLHPHIHGGILADRDDKSHVSQLTEAGILAIDLVVVNLYPFREAVAQDLEWRQIIEQIDIGGPALIRAAAKNHTGVAVVVDPASYDAVLEEIRMTGGLESETRRALAAEAFAHTAAYDAAIARWMARDETFPEHLSIALERVQTLRYGENPHQGGALYAEVGGEGGVARGKQLHGKDLSFNNLLDTDAAWETAQEFEEPAVAIIKHGIPCGVAVGTNVAEAYERALESDQVSAFGGVVAVNAPLTRDAARKIAEIFTECVAAPSFEPGALEVLMEKKNLRIMQVEEPGLEPSMRRVSGGMLIQDPDVFDDERDEMRVVTKAQPTDEQWKDLLFAWKACKHVRSNAIVLATNGATVGIGGGQTSRVDAVEIAVRKAGDRARGSVLASDAFFPFPDGPLAAIKGGVAAMIQPGGSVRDDETIAACDEAGVPMIFTGIRHFRHG